MTYSTSFSMTHSETRVSSFTNTTIIYQVLDPSDGGVFLFEQGFDQHDAGYIMMNGTRVSNPNPILIRAINRTRSYSTSGRGQMVLLSTEDRVMSGTAVTLCFLRNLAVPNSNSSSLLGSSVDSYTRSLTVAGARNISLSIASRLSGNSSLRFNDSFVPGGVRSLLVDVVSPTRPIQRAGLDGVIRFSDLYFDNCFPFRGRVIVRVLPEASVLSALPTDGTVEIVTENTFSLLLLPRRAACVPAISMFTRTSTPNPSPRPPASTIPPIQTAVPNGPASTSQPTAAPPTPLPAPTLPDFSFGWRETLFNASGPVSQKTLNLTLSEYTSPFHVTVKDTCGFPIPFNLTLFPWGPQRFATKSTAGRRRYQTLMGTVVTEDLPNMVNDTLFWSQAFVDPLQVISNFSHLRFDISSSVVMDFIDVVATSAGSSGSSAGTGSLDAALASAMRGWNTDRCAAVDLPVKVVYPPMLQTSRTIVGTTVVITTYFPSPTTIPARVSLNAPPLAISRLAVAPARFLFSSPLDFFNLERTATPQALGGMVTFSSSISQIVAPRGFLYVVQDNLNFQPGLQAELVESDTSRNQMLLNTSTNFFFTIKINPVSNAFTRYDESINVTLLPELVVPNFNFTDRSYFLLDVGIPVDSTSIGKRWIAVLAVWGTSINVGLLALIGEASDCSQDLGTEIDLVLHPLAFAVGNLPERYFYGAVISNTAIVGFFLFVEFVLFNALKATPENEGWRSFPHYTLRAAVPLYPGTIFSAMKAFQSDPHSLKYALATSTLFYGFGLPIALVFLAFRYCATWIDETKTNSASAFRKFFIGTGHYDFRHFDHIRARLSYANYRGPMAIYGCVMDLVLTMICAFFAWLPCPAVNLGLLVVIALHLLFVLAGQPFTTIGKNFFIALVDFTQIVGCIVYYRGDERTGRLIHTSIVLGASGVNIIIIMWEFLTSSSLRRTVDNLVRWSGSGGIATIIFGPLNRLLQFFRRSLPADAWESLRRHRKLVEKRNLEKTELSNRYLDSRRSTEGNTKEIELPLLSQAASVPSPSTVVVTVAEGEHENGATAQQPLEDPNDFSKWGEEEIIERSPTPHNNSFVSSGNPTPRAAASAEAVAPVVPRATSSLATKPISESAGPKARATTVAEGTTSSPSRAETTRRGASGEVPRAASQSRGNRTTSASPPRPKAVIWLPERLRTFGKDDDRTVVTRLFVTENGVQEEREARKHVWRNEAGQRLVVPERDTAVTRIPPPSELLRSRPNAVRDRLRAAGIPPVSEEEMFKGSSRRY
jgi:hypothetical protein